MKKEIKTFREKILRNAIIVVEDNDYLGLLIEKAKVVVKSGGEPFNTQTSNMLVTEITEALREFESYRILNLATGSVIVQDELYDYRYFERYFKARTIAGKKVLSKLEKFIPEAAFILKSKNQDIEDTC